MSVAALLDANEGSVAALIVEPVPANMGVVPPDDGYLEGLRLLCDDHGALLIFDEVITGFRIARGGAQERFGVTPDLTVLGKVMGGGFPCAAFGGQARPDGAARARGPACTRRERSAGTRSRWRPAWRPSISSTPRTPTRASRPTAEDLQAGLAAAFEANGIDATINRAGSLFSVFFSEGPDQELR